MPNGISSQLLQNVTLFSMKQHRILQQFYNYLSQSSKINSYVS